MREFIVIFVAIFLTNVAVRLLHIPDWFVFVGIIVALLVAIIDYYWLGGKLNRGNRHYGKK